MFCENVIFPTPVCVSDAYLRVAKTVRIGNCSTAGLEMREGSKFSLLSDVSIFFSKTKIVYNLWIFWGHLEIFGACREFFWAYRDSFFFKN